ncbi:fimbrial protein StdA [Salmonella enterica subsp. diarizonae]|uniref:Fimbrial protein StdA n=1 Tax=Salmonella diarizonae TaxID=59204 RepID=A0A6C8Y3L8_SALDZ|nr:fimbrial protein StdA [Salmonella enterica subsp. diarizonae]
MRNKIALAVTAACAMLYGASAFAVDTPPTTGPFGTGTVTFTGTITNAPCDIQTGDENLSVNFGQVSYRALKAADAVDNNNAKQFTIHLQNCEFDPDTSTNSGTTNPVGQMSKVQIAFSGVPAAGSKKAFISTTNTNLGVQLLGLDGQPITPSNTPDFSSTNPTQQLQPYQNTFTYTAKLMNVGAENSVTAGAFSIPVSYTLKYQ